MLLNPKTASSSWDAFADVDAFVDEVLVELTVLASEGERQPRPGPTPRPTDAPLCKVMMAIVRRLLWQIVYTTNLCEDCFTLS